MIMNKFYIYNKSKGCIAITKQHKVYSKIYREVRKLIVLFCLMVAALIFNVISSYGQCTVGVSSVTGADIDPARQLGSSFTACQNGTISTFMFLSMKNQDDLSFTIYEGEGISGSVIATVNNVSLKASKDPSDWSVIDVSSLNINVTNNSVYTFYFTTPVHLFYQTSDIIPGGNYYHMDGSLLSFPTYDVEYNISFTAPLTPTVTTAAASSISVTSATLGGNVTDQGVSAVSERGVVYSTTDATPTIAEGATKDDNGSGTGAFSESIGSLSSGTTYYYNAYAINSEGTSYGTAKSFIPTSLTDGDIAFTRINGDADSFSFVALTDIPSSTAIYFSDEYWDGSEFESEYYTILFTATSDIDAGDEVHIVFSTLTATFTSGTATGTLTDVGVSDALGANFIQAAGDNIMAFQGSIASPFFIAAISSNTGESGTSGNAWQTTSASYNTILPAGKTNGQDGYLGLFPVGATQSEVDNARYKTDAPHSGDKATLLSEIMDLCRNPL